MIALQSLELLVLRNTSLTGALTSLVRSQCSAFLSSVDLSENSISGPVSDILSFEVCSSIVSLNLSKNSLDSPMKEDKA